MIWIATALVLVGLACDAFGALLALAPDLVPKASDIDRLFEGLHGRQTPYTGWRGWATRYVTWDGDMEQARRRTGALLLAFGFALQFAGVLLGAITS